MSTGKEREFARQRGETINAPSGVTVLHFEMTTLIVAERLVRERDPRSVGPSITPSHRGECVRCKTLVVGTSAVAVR